MRVRYDAYRDGYELVAKAIVRLNKHERKRLEHILQKEGEVMLCFCTTIFRVENPLVIEQTKEVPFELDEDWNERRELSDLLGMVEDEVEDLRYLLGGECDAKADVA